MSTWRGAPPPDPVPISAAGWLRVFAKGVPLALVVFGGLAVHMILRAIEAPAMTLGARISRGSALARPVTPWVTVGVCRAALTLIGLRCKTTGAPMRRRGALVANHSSWLDIFVLNAAGPLYFVSKSEVAGWPGIGWLARATGTVFIRRDPREARAQTALFEARLRAGHRLLFFPEGTSTDGMRVLPFKATLFGAFFAEGLRDAISVQPVSVVYTAPAGADPRFYGWWGDMAFGAHLLHLLAAPRHGRVAVDWHAPVEVAASPDRKALARATEAAIRLAVERRRELGQPPQGVGR
ncbi:1-acyl-sn-glycerol-3-phosphate acyltransferase [Palleronia sediminis]|uniref:1-acyl-sn-glycerol-3-phosphate acyltransferase n=1 Tax=Palleronia sediminis TaxID=2547833 RepID=A0A4R6AJT7_9RHOB|nr:lysophospholipid acyltransferase family protein [Palleronia sediminis]TDL83532.1 1-acyl-sn-glycerol-3-phosphate acyltransferase [Palleronia sediminis]